MSDPKISRIVAAAVRDAQHMALTYAIETCELFVAEGGSAAQCVKALRDLKDSVPLAPDKMD